MLANERNLLGHRTNIVFQILIGNNKDSKKKCIEIKVHFILGTEWRRNENGVFVLRYIKRQNGTRTPSSGMRQYH